MLQRQADVNFLRILVLPIGIALLLAACSASEGSTEPVASELVTIESAKAQVSLAPSPAVTPAVEPVLTQPEPTVTAPLLTPTAVTTKEPTTNSNQQPATPDVEPPTAGSDEVVLVWSMIGGCAEPDIPPCPEWTILANGTVQLRPASDAGDFSIDADGTVDTDVIAEWTSVASTIDIPALFASLPVGPCSAAVDGIDAQFVAPWLDVAASECGYEFVATEPFFATMFALVAAAEEAAPYSP